jgi:heme A synthase
MVASRHPEPRLLPAARTLLAIGAAGSALALVILGVSILLRLTTVFTDAGDPVSTLPVAIESAVRLLHRLAASSVGLLALWATALCWMRRPHAATAVMPTAAMVAATLVLAAIGPLTPGYRFATVTVANVVGGTVLLMACWWLREAMTAAPARQARDPLLRPALMVFLAHAGLGAAASALSVRGIRWLAFAHMGSAALVVIFAGALLWDRRSRAPLTRLVGAMTLLLAAQIALGLALMAADPHPVWLGFVHAMLSPLLAAGLVSIAVRDSTGGRSLAGNSSWPPSVAGG